MIQTFKYHGIVEIDLIVQNQTNSIEFNSVDLAFNSISFSNPSLVAISSQSCNVEKETCRLDLSNSLDVGTSFTMRIDYEGVLNDQMHGFYRSKYSYAGQDHWLATTQFEAVGTVPCLLPIPTK